MAGDYSHDESERTPARVMEDISSPALHPDGVTILFLRPDRELWTGSLKGGPAHEFWWQAPGRSLISGEVLD